MKIPPMKPCRKYSPVGVAQKSSQSVDRHYFFVIVQEHNLSLIDADKSMNVSPILRLHAGSQDKPRGIDLCCGVT